MHLVLYLLWVPPFVQLAIYITNLSQLILTLIRIGKEPEYSIPKMIFEPENTCLMQVSQLEEDFWSRNSSYKHIHSPQGCYIGQIDQLSLRSGYGQFLFSQTNDVYSGNWNLDMKNGKGTMRYATADNDLIEIYNGDWANDQKQGKGQILQCLRSCPTNCRQHIVMSGDFANGQITVGSYWMGKGVEYYGQFLNNVPHGQGKIVRRTEEEGQIFFQGTYQFGLFVSGKRGDV